MKTAAMSLVAYTTLVLIILTIMVGMNISFNWVFYLTLVGQAMLIYMVYRVLADNCKTDKTFEDFYEYNPIRFRE